MNASPRPGPSLVDYWQVLRARRPVVLAVSVAVVALSVLRVLVMQPVYVGVAQILVERENPNVVSFKEVSEVDASRDDYHQTQQKLLQSRALVRQVITGLNLLQHPEYEGPRSEAELKAILTAPPGASPVLERAIDRFLERLRVQLLRNSRILTVSYESHVPEMAAAVANSLTELYIQQSLDFRYRTSAEAARWLGAQVDDQRKKVEAAEIALQRFKEREGIVNIEERRALLEQRLKELGTSLTTLKTQRLEKQALWRSMRDSSSPEALPEVLRDPLVQSLRVELASLERQEAKLLGLYGPKHPEVLRVQKQIGETRRKGRDEATRMIQAARNDYEAVAAQEASLAEALEAAKREAADLSARGVQYDTLKRELDAGKEVLNSILAREKETDVTRELKASNIRIVDPAGIPQKPDRPRKVRDMALGLAFGLVLGVGLAFFLDYLDNTLKTPDDVRARLGATLLAVIPEIERATAAGKVAALSTEEIGESASGVGYRTLRTALSYSWADKSSRIVVVTSTAPGEGKTLTSLNLARALALVSHRVLLIDTDFRKAQAHSAFRVARSPGFSDVLAGQRELSEAVQRTSDANLDVFPAGRPVPSPSDLLCADVVPKLLNGLRGVYEWIVIDTPPVAAVIDPLVIAPLGDGVIVVAGAEMVPRQAVGDTIDRLAATGARLLGVVLNRARIEKHGYHYSYHYGYGAYGYGEAQASAATGTSASKTPGPRPGGRAPKSAS